MNIMGGDIHKIVSPAHIIVHNVGPQLPRATSRSIGYSMDIYTNDTGLPLCVRWYR
jgi:hypothetical protein